MGWMVEKIIEAHSNRMKTDSEYAEQCRFEWATEDHCREMEMIDESEIDWFPEYRIDHSGYQENVLNADELPF